MANPSAWDLLEPLWFQVTRSALKLPLPSSQFIWLSLPPSHLSPPSAHQLVWVSLTEYDHMSATPLPCQRTEIDRQPEKPAFLRRPRRWQLRPSRTTSNVTRCWHSLSTHSLTHSVPSLASFCTLHSCHFNGRHSYAARCTCVWKFGARARAPCSAFFSTSRGRLRMFVHLSGHVWCHNTDMSTASNIVEQNWGCCEAFFLFFFHSRIPATSSVSRQELHLCHRYAYIDKELQRLQTQGFQRQTNWLENATAELWHHWDYFWKQPIIVGDVRLGGSVSTICAAVACNSDQEE